MGSVCVCVGLMGLDRNSVTLIVFIIICGATFIFAVGVYFLINLYINEYIANVTTPN